MQAGTPVPPDDGTSQWYIHWLLWRIFKPEYAVELANRLSTERSALKKKDVTTLRAAVDDILSKYI